MDLEDDFWVAAMSTNGWVSAFFLACMIGAGFYYCNREKKCPEGTIYWSDKDVCINKDALSKPGEPK